MTRLHRWFIPIAAMLIVAVAALPQQKPSKLRVTVVGQSLIHGDLRKNAPAFMDQAKKYLAGADVRFTNLEAAVAPGDAPITPRKGAERVEPDVLDCLRELGFNLLSLSNNHAMDLGEGGLRATRAEVAKRGFVYAGTGTNLAEALTPGFLDTPAGKIALIGMASGATQLSSPDTWASPNHAGVNYLEQLKDGTLNPEHKARILEAIRSAVKQSAGVIVYHHNHLWGDLEGSALPPGREKRISRFETHPWQVELAHQVIDAGALMYVAHGDPSLHGVEIYKGKPIFYSLGNYIFMSSGTPDTYGPLASMSAIAQVEFDGGNVSSIRFRPIVLSLAKNGDAPRGVPYLAEGGEARMILLSLAEASKRFGTDVRIEGDSGVVEIKKK